MAAGAMEIMLCRLSPVKLFHFMKTNLDWKRKRNCVRAVSACEFLVAGDKGPKQAKRRSVPSAKAVAPIAKD
jgi:hypothetical protein